MDPHRFNADPDPAFFLIADPDPVLNPGFWWPSKKNIQHCQHKNSLLFGLLNPDPDFSTEINADPWGSGSTTLRMLSMFGTWSRTMTFKCSFPFRTWSLCKNLISVSVCLQQNYQLWYGEKGRRRQLREVGKRMFKRKMDIDRRRPRLIPKYNHI